MILLIW